MSGGEMRETGENQPSSSTNGLLELSSFSFPSYDMTPDSKKKNRKSQPCKSEGEEQPETGKTYQCNAEGCDRIFSSRFKLVRHVLIHSGERRFQCTACGRRFHRKDHLKNHVQVHDPNKIFFSCSVCRKKYSSHLSYRKHMALHSAEAGDPVCQLCGKDLASKEGILQHVKVHNGSRTMRGPSERKFPCDRCDKSFFTKKDVKRHNVVHTGNRDFSCQYCPQRFGRKDHLVRHRKKSHPRSNDNSPVPVEPVQPAHFDPQILIPKENGKLSSHIGPAPLPDISSLVISSPVSVMEPPVIEAPKQEPYIAPSTSMVQPSFGIGHMPTENGQNMGRFNDPSLLPVSQYLPISPTYPAIAPMMPPHYINMSTSNGLLSDLLPPMTAAPSFQTSVPLDIASPPLPHFSQAFQ